MQDEVYDDMAIERLSKERFGVNVEISQVIARSIPVSRTATATVFLTDKKQLYVYVTAKSRLVLGDVMKIMSRMGLRVELYLPPVGNPDYFNVIGREKFEQVFPGRTYVADDELRFYRTLAPYNPALVLIGEVKDGEIRQFDSDARGGWRVATKFTYRRIRTS